MKSLSLILFILFKTSYNSFIVILKLDPINALGKIKASLKSKGKPIPENDIWIAATCHSANLTLITADSDFDYIDDFFSFVLNPRLIIYTISI